ncbi:glycosyltransferase family 1 protein [Psychromarinibacter sp. C21-152]|uniref:Glycosyltransferase family 1 protein n=1 Tax=Psychromarinibacter sediminicola TaxID=3033385 RepID=A0AAE3T9B6_9RHOB|nr:glycosyltransferase family 1 protein [Psychromarinibacter sediminicola]MDF0601688.1 glycosyltransferase family 1 protein [Psychromarinibacter sediminicola]
MSTRITINGKFMSGSVTAGGVHRAALNFSAELCRRATGQSPCRIMAPAVRDRTSVAAMGLQPELRPGWSRAGGQAWEMLVLPALARKDLLINFCNLAPVLHPNSVVMIHDVQTLAFPDAYPRRQVQGYRLFWPMIGRRARAVLTVSDYSRQSIAEHGIAPLDRIHVVRNGTDHILRAAPDAGVLDRLELRGRVFAMTFGTTQSYKNLKTLFAAFEDPRLAEIPLVVVGGPPRRDYDALGWRIPPNVIFTGHVGDGELRALYTAAGAFLFPSRTEGFGLPPVEAMHCGTPALVARGGALPETVGTGAELVDPLDPEAWAHAAERVLSDSAHRDALVARGAARAAELTWRQAGDALWDRVSALL